MILPRATSDGPSDEIPIAGLELWPLRLTAAVQGGQRHLGRDMIVQIPQKNAAGAWQQWPPANGPGLRQVRRSLFDAVDNVYNARLQQAESGD